MKILIVFVLILFNNGRCNTKMESNQRINFVEYKATTRGSSFSCKILGNEIIVQSQGEENFEKARKIRAEEWNDILESVDKLNLEAIHNYKASTNSSATDRTRIARLVISSNQKLYESKPFDEGYAPRELKSLINKVMALANSLD